MKTLFLRAFAALFFLLLISCNKGLNSNDTLALNPNIEKLELSSEKIVQDWDAYQDLEHNLKLICNTNSLNATSYRRSLMSNIKAMEHYIPQPFNTQDVKNRIEEIDFKITSFYNEVHEDELSKPIVQRHVNDIMTAFGNLNKTLNKTKTYSN